MPSAAAPPPVVLVTGASSGIGKACAELLAARGFLVYGTSRHASPVVAGKPAAGTPPVLRMIPLDVTSDESVDAAVSLVLASEGRIDAVVNNAGFGIAGAVELTSMDEAHAQFETNFFGTVRVCRAVLPAMRRQGSGRIVNVSSIAGAIGIPFQAFYSASKFAIEGFSEALRMEAAPFGIHVTLVEPGDFRTGFTAARRLAAASVARGSCPAGEAYAAAESRALAVMEHDEVHGATPEVVGRLVHRILTMRSPGVRYAVGPASEKAALLLKRILPSRLLAWGIGKYYRVE
jgi:NAD(P)-dependent dehydrogenase (short-subunit alcohol dehydrogenase family)